MRGSTDVWRFCLEMLGETIGMWSPGVSIPCLSIRLDDIFDLVARQGRNTRAACCPWPWRHGCESAAIAAQLRDKLAQLLSHTANTVRECAHGSRLVTPASCSEAISCLNRSVTGRGTSARMPKHAQRTAVRRLRNRIDELQVWRSNKPFSADNGRVRDMFVVDRVEFVVGDQICEAWAIRDVDAVGCE